MESTKNMLEKSASDVSMPVNNEDSLNTTNDSPKENTFITPARARRHLDKININYNVNKELAVYKNQLSNYELKSNLLTTHKVGSGEEERDATAEEMAVAQQFVTDNESRMENLKNEYAALSGEKTRFSHDASVALSTTCDELTRQMLEHALGKAILCKKKIIQVVHLHDELETIKLYPLIKSLPLIVDTTNTLAKQKYDKDIKTAVANALSQYEKESKVKKSSNKTTTEADSTSDAKEDKSSKKNKNMPATDSSNNETSDVTDAVESKTSFQFYVHSICKELIKTNELYNQMRISTEIRVYISTVLTQFVQRLSNLVVVFSHSLKSKTVNDSTIMRVVEMLLIDGHDRKESFDFTTCPETSKCLCARTVTYPTSAAKELIQLVDEKLKLYKNNN